jgi:uroporphyrinogen decarboxylase
VQVPITLFSKGGAGALQGLLQSQASMLGVDWMTSMQEAVTMTQGQFALQGNLDPTVLYGTRELIAKEVNRCMSAFTNVYPHNTGHVFNLGHGILPDMNPDSVAFLIDCVHNYKHK